MGNARYLCLLLTLACSESGPGAGTSPSLAGSGGSAGASGSAAVSMSGAGASNQAGQASTGGGAGGTAEGGHSGEAGTTALAGGGAGGMLVEDQGPAAWRNTPFIMDTWFWNDAAAPAAAQALVKEKGFAGFALSADHQVAAHVTALATSGLPMVGIWAPATLGQYPTGLVDSVMGTGGLIWLSLQGAPQSDATHDAEGLAIITALADECKTKGLPGVALYPHVGFWVERVSDAVRLAGKAARPDVGVVFNQYHWMVAEGGQDLKGTLAAAEPYLKIVTLNGSDVAPSILPLGSGAYDVAPILAAVAELHFTGSVGLQGYSITGELASKLQASRQAWDALLAGLPTP